MEVMNESNGPGKFYFRRYENAYMLAKRGYDVALCSDDFLKLIARARLADDLEKRLEKLSVHGSDGCRNCETGRITIYAKERWCMECLSRAALKEESK